MSKYNKQLSVIDSESITNQPDSEGGGVNLPDNYILIRHNTKIILDSTDPTRVYILDPRFPSNVTIKIGSYGQTTNYSGFAEDIRVRNCFVSDNFSTTPMYMYGSDYGMTIYINNSYIPDVPVNLDPVVLIEFNKNPFA